MFNIKILPQAYQKIDMYVLNYRNYFEDLYKDSGIWDEEKIISSYCQEAEERYFQILDILKEKLSDTVITYPNNTTIIRWRSKILLVSFQDEDDTRIITDLEIR